MTMERYQGGLVPDPESTRDQIKALNAFQAVVRQLLVKDLDYGVIPGTSKPTLLKPGAEKIIKLLGLTDQYEFEDRQEDWSRQFFRYLVKCRLYMTSTNVLITEGIGECNSTEPKYRYRWVFQSDLPEMYQGDAGKPARDKLVHRKIRTKYSDGANQYRIDNDEVGGIVNTLIKMARKRALVDAALTAGRLSELFTQDVEDLGPVAGESAAPVPDPDEPPAPETKRQQDPDLKTMLDALQSAYPDVWTVPTIIKSLDKRSGNTSETIDAAIASLSPEQLRDVTDLTRATYGRIGKRGVNYNESA